jgi:hypothetical protein
VLPKNTEYEIGFTHYLQKIILLAKQAGARIVVYTGRKTQAAVQKYITNAKASVELTFKDLENLEDFLVLARSISSDDLLVVVSARKGTLSYQPYLEGTPARLGRHFKENNVLLIYPEQTAMENSEPGIQDGDITLMPIQEQLVNINKIRKAVTKIFRGNKPKGEIDEEV